MTELTDEQKNAFIEELMLSNELKGASKKRLVRFLCDRYCWDMQKVRFRLKRAILAEKYAQAH